MQPAWYSSGIDHIWLPYTQMKTSPPPLPVSHTDGVRIFLDDGRVLIDGIASWWTACHGYNHTHIRKLLVEQLERMPHVMFGGLVHEPALKLATRLVNLFPESLNRVFFSESGSVSVEVAIKMSIQFWVNKGYPEKNKILAFWGGYHGDTSGAMSVCDPEEGMHKLFKGAIPEQYIIKLPRTENDLSTLEKFLSNKAKKCAAMIVEPLVQGAGGMIFHGDEVLIRLRELCDRHDILLIFDEIFTGFARTGTLFAFQQGGVSPDILTLSKALTGGTIPLAATVAKNNVFEAFLNESDESALMHGPTFMANPLSCAAANASLDLFESKPILKEVCRISSQMNDELERCRSIPGVADVRVKGAIGVVELSGKISLDWLRQQFVEEGVWIRPFGNIVYLTPAYTISQQDLSVLTSAIYQVVSKWSQK
ncbi:MAG: adenosylmethionine--8-amino-7-oxononanoate transaminase [Rhodospirillaceae bacterium]|nr:adenosylmethionine--8-amino-7-oxononanoate transaminase [Alphaproteobacteria bacterium]MBR72173.1 adenosylmethionine--8-amino-7-oxononanoate transaminase [Rhodospirillaceae bacterium]|tara:strand:- start:1118 stop:2386 length:1269 start_codon:yes stop_codon:yes gene_type:complete